MNLQELTAQKAAEAVNDGEITARRLIEKTLEANRANNKKYNTLIAMAENEALDQADSVDQRIKKGLNLPLAGVPLVIKDDFAYSPLPTSFGSQALKGYYSPFNAAAVDKLLGAGAVIIGKANTGDMGLGSTTATSPAGRSLCPLDPGNTAISAGAAAVAAGQALLALESDCGGGLQQGAAQCSLFGLRPTPGRISRYGLNLSSGSFCQPGVTGASARDIGIAMQAMTGYDERDIQTAGYLDARTSGSLPAEPDQISLGFISFPDDCLTEREERSWNKMLTTLRSRGYKMESFQLEYMAEALRAYYVIAYAETSSSFSRFDGIRFGLDVEAEDLEEQYFKSRQMILGEEARKRSIFGTYFLSEGNFDFYYRRALKVWALIKRELAMAMSRYDLLVLPVAPQLTLQNLDLLDHCNNDLFTVPVSMAGLPSLSLPLADSGNIIGSIQLIGKPFGEEIVLNTAEQLSDSSTNRTDRNDSGEVE